MNNYVKDAICKCLFVTLIYIFDILLNYLFFHSLFDLMNNDWNLFCTVCVLSVDSSFVFCSCCCCCCCWFFSSVYLYGISCYAVWHEFINNKFQISSWLMIFLFFCFSRLMPSKRRSTTNTTAVVVTPKKVCLRRTF